MAKRVDPGSVALTVPPERTGLRRLGYAIAGLPFIVILFAAVFAPGFFEPAYANPPEILGLPAGIVVLFLAATWASIAFLAIRETRSGIGIGIALLAFTIPSTIVIILVPSVILVVLNLSL